VVTTALPAGPVFYCSGVTRETEGETERDWRRHQRGLFDGVARLYAATLPGYPLELADFAVTTAGAGPGSAVLEVGCGTGQLTERLGSQAEVGLTLEAAVTMARVRKPASGG
jgi:2-polyprenyl-3-methyl-5-hydroxy-6-metoxy-1,4-benzoquinol methylase